MLSAMKRTIATLALIVLASAAFANEDLGARIDRLLHRWTAGDVAARTGVAAETRALGDEAISELYRRLARRNWDFPAPALGARFSKSKDTPRKGAVVNTEVKFVTPAEGVAMPEGKTLLPDAFAKEMVKMGTVISAPRLTIYDGQRANVSLIKQQTYARTFDRDGAEVRGMASEGTVLEIRPRLLDGGKRISLELRWEQSELIGEIAQIKTREGTVGAPTTLKREFAVTLVVESGKPVTLAVPGGKPMLLVVTATAIELE